MEKKETERMDTKKELSKMEKKEKEIEGMGTKKELSDKQGQYCVSSSCSRRFKHN